MFLDPRYTDLSEKKNRCLVVGVEVVFQLYVTRLLSCPRQWNADRRKHLRSIDYAVSVQSDANCANEWQVV